MAAEQDIERAVLAVIVAHDQRDTVEDLTPAHFGATTNRAIFEALLQLRQEGRPFDEPTLTAALTRRDTLGAAGGKAGVSALYYHDTALRANLPSYLRDLRQARHRRRLTQTLAALAKASEDHEKTLPELIEHVEREVLGVTREVSGEGQYVDASTMVADALALVEAAHERGDGLVGVDSGIQEVNDLIGGWEAGTFTVLMGTPGVGKTALWLQSALHVAQRQPAAVAQLEMTPAKMGMRALSSHGRISFRRMRRGNELNDRDFTRLADAAGSVAGRQLHIAPSSINDWADLKAWFRRMHLDHGAQSLWIDNLKVIGMPRVKDLDRLNAITRELKVLSRELNVPVIAIHHLHRLEEGKKPSLTSGYGSSSIEQDADNVLALWKPDEEIDNEVQLLPLKTRDDRAKPSTLEWIGDQQRYQSIREEDAPPVPLYAS